MRDVAEASGVSAQTVSRVLSDHRNVKETTREKVLAAVEKLGYRHNNTARALVTGRSKTLGVLTLATKNYSRASLSLGIELGARDAGYTVNSVTSTMSLKGLTESVSRLLLQGVDGIILASPFREAASTIRRLTAGIPTITMGGSAGTCNGSVGIDQDQAAELATRHLLELGHKTVWHIAGPREWSDASLREESWRRTLIEAGCLLPPVLYGDWSPSSGHRNGLILGTNPKVTAILVASDEMAFGVIRALTELGLHVPKDVSVVGIDDIDLAAYSTPPLTTIRQSFEETGRRAVQHLVGLINKPGMTNLSSMSAPTLIVRGSTAPPPADWASKVCPKPHRQDCV
ncbi:LacI family DNA-binding transcriptional regulator [Arthrobacter cryoconiti]|uniref:LacI family DNA-binding transcriptional regulator n=1 Tax=Arthrobacter cryoconiti TaxID=748907 RepID=A0ABV8R1G4_9MICC|nr:LacI family DNA-binding transcriptional regulator [Arthrobacter cryoconiti]MCC9068251.1 LacI family transcriptional regulator [Arthrobacter cryoconiti]